MARLTKRSSPKDVEAPKPLPQRGEAEPETFICEDAKTVVTAKEKQPSMGMCDNCHLLPSHSEVDHLCYNCHRAKAGFVFDDEAKRYVKEKK